MVYNNSTNLYGTNAFIVSSTPGKGNYLTIASAITAASSGDTVFIKDGDYTEDLTMKAGVNLTTDYSDGNSSGVTITGTVTCNYTGSCYIAGISLKPNVSACIASASGTPVLNLINCYIICANTTYAMGSNNAAFQIILTGCTADTTSPTNTLFSWSSIDFCQFVNCNFANQTYGITEVCLAYSNKTEFDNCINEFPITCNGTGYVIINNTTMDTSAGNAWCLTVNNSTTGVSQVNNSTLYSGTAGGIRTGTSTQVYVSYSMLYNTNTYDISTA